MSWEGKWLLLVTPWTIAHQAPLSMGFSRQEYWKGLPFSSSGDLPDPGIESGSPALQADSLLSKLPEKPFLRLYSEMQSPTIYKETQGSRGDGRVTTHTAAQGRAEEEFKHKPAGFLNPETTWLQNGFAVHRWWTPKRKNTSLEKTVDPLWMEAQNPPPAKLWLFRYCSYPHTGSWFTSERQSECSGPAQGPWRPGMRPGCYSLTLWLWLII